MERRAVDAFADRRKAVPRGIVRFRRTGSDAESALIERSAVPENRRMVLVSPTKKAMDMRESVDQIVQDMNRHFLGHFLPDEQRRLKAFLRRVIDTSPND